MYEWSYSHLEGLMIEKITSQLFHWLFRSHYKMLNPIHQLSTYHMSIIYNIYYLPKIRLTWAMSLPVANKIVINTKIAFIKSKRIPLNMKRGAKIFHTIKCRLKCAAKMKLDTLTTVWYANNDVVFATICESTVIGFEDGASFHNVINGTATHTRMKDPKVLRTMFKCVKGKVIVSVVMNPTSHWIDGIVAWCPVLK